jgi:hypothetical protein
MIVTVAGDIIGSDYKFTGLKHFSELSKSQCTCCGNSETVLELT